MITPTELKIIVKEGEGLNIEFKEAYTPKIGETITAFANAKGGNIILGVTDDGKIKGCKLTNKQKAEITDLSRNCSPSIEIKVRQVENIAVIEVPEGQEKPYHCSGGYYRRMDAVTQKMNANEIKNMYRENMNVPFEELINKKFTLKDISFEKIREFLKESGVRLTITKANTLDFLQSLKLAEGSKIKNAAVLMFAKDVGKFFLQSQIALLLFKDHDKVEFIDRKQIRAVLSDQFNEAMMFIEKHLSRRSKIVGVNRIDSYEIPIEAVREAVVNAIIHRDYSISGTDITVEIYPDTLEISSPGGLPSGMLSEELGRKSVRRNELLADMFFRMDKIEKTGTGIRRIKDAVKKAGLREPHFESTGFFTTKFYLPATAEGYGMGAGAGGGFGDGTGFGGSSANGGLERTGKRLVEGLVEGLVESQKKMLGIITANPKVSKRELAETVGISETAIDKNISTLKKKGIIKRIGPDKGGRWVVNG